MKTATKTNKTKTEYYVLGTYGSSKIQHLLLGLDVQFKPTIRKEFLDVVIMNHVIEGLKNGKNRISMLSYGPFNSDLHLVILMEKPEWLIQ